MKRAEVSITAELLKQRLELPPDVIVTGAEWDARRNAVKLFVAGDCLPSRCEVREAESPGLICPIDVTDLAEQLAE